MKTILFISLLSLPLSAKECDPKAEKCTACKTCDGCKACSKMGAKCSVCRPLAKRIIRWIFK